jgi:hypothetical protein
MFRIIHAIVLQLSPIGKGGIGALIPRVWESNHNGPSGAWDELNNMSTFIEGGIYA